MRSFASNEKSKFWSSKNIKSSREVFNSSHEPYLFDCNKCGHEFETTPSIVTSGCWCPYCGGQRLCDNQKCKLCFDKSLASHEKSRFWSSKNYPLLPRNVFRGNQSEYLFDCNVCSHEFNARPNNVTNGHWCPYCGHQKLCHTPSCVPCYNNSFANHEKVKFFSYKNGSANPRNIFKGSNDQKYWFICEKDMTLICYQIV